MRDGIVLSRRRFIAGLAGVLTLLMATPGVAFATSWGSSTRVVIGKVEYKVASGIDAGLTAKASVTATATTKVKARSFAVQATLRNALGAVVKSSGYVYNTTSLTATASCKAPRPAGPSYYAVGVISAGGIKQNAKPSPTCYGAKPSYSVNSSGQTYGPLPNSVEEKAPDLISVVGVGGRPGYVYFGVFDAAEAGAVVPVFAEDGQTIVDQFHFEND